MHVQSTTTGGGDYCQCEERCPCCGKLKRMHAEVVCDQMQPNLNQVPLVSGSINHGYSPTWLPDLWSVVSHASTPSVMRAT